MSKKVLSITTVAVIVIVAISGAYFYHKSQNKNCVYYYDKTGTKILFKDCGH